VGGESKVLSLLRLDGEVGSRDWCIWKSRAGSIGRVSRKIRSRGKDWIKICTCVRRRSLLHTGDVLPFREASDFFPVRRAGPPVVPGAPVAHVHTQGDRCAKPVFFVKDRPAVFRSLEYRKVRFLLLLWNSCKARRRRYLLTRRPIQFC